MYEIVLDTIDPDNPEFTGFLAMKGIQFEKLDSTGNYVVVRYIGVFWALIEMIMIHFTSGDDETDKERVDEIRKAVTSPIMD
jgi:hypothetical protein